MGAVVGIDLGTTNTVVAAARDGSVVALPDESGSTLVPSIVSFLPSGAVLVGNAARERRSVDARNTIYSIKRLIGRTWGSSEVEQAVARFPFELREGPGRATFVVARGETYTLPEISAFVLRKAKSIAELELGESVDRAVITVPANFNDLQRAATKVAGRVAGLEVLRVLNEPTAAALAFGHAHGDRECIAVYDFGGGTFDFTLLRLTDDVFEVLATAGDTYLGGDDIDAAIVASMARRIASLESVDARTQPDTFERLRAAAEEIKTSLSTQRDVCIRLQDYEIAQASGLEFSMTRTEFEELEAPIVERTFEVCRSALALAKIALKDISQVLLVGGSTRDPFVKHRAEQFFGRRARAEVDPHEVVALGAARQAMALTQLRATASGIPLAPVPRAPADDIGSGNLRKQTDSGVGESEGIAPVRLSVPPPEEPLSLPAPTTQTLGSRDRRTTGLGLGPAGEPAATSLPNSRNDARNEPAPGTGLTGESALARVASSAETPDLPAVIGPNRAAQPAVSGAKPAATTSRLGVQAAPQRQTMATATPDLSVTFAAAIVGASPGTTTTGKSEDAAVPRIRTAPVVRSTPSAASSDQPQPVPATTKLLTDTASDLPATIAAAVVNPTSPRRAAAAPRLGDVTTSTSPIDTAPLDLPATIASAFVAPKTAEKRTAPVEATASAPNAPRADAEAAAAVIRPTSAGRTAVAMGATPYAASTPHVDPTQTDLPATIASAVVGTTATPKTVPAKAIATAQPTGVIAARRSPAMSGEPAILAPAVVNPTVAVTTEPPRVPTTPLGPSAAIPSAELGPNSPSKSARTSTLPVDLSDALASAVVKPGPTAQYGVQTVPTAMGGVARPGSSVALGSANRMATNSPGTTGPAKDIGPSGRMAGELDLPIVAPSPGFNALAQTSLRFGAPHAEPGPRHAHEPRALTSADDHDNEPTISRTAVPALPKQYDAPSLGLPPLDSSLTGQVEESEWDSFDLSPDHATHAAPSAETGAQAPAQPRLSEAEIRARYGNLPLIVGGRRVGASEAGSFPASFNEPDARQFAGNPSTNRRQQSSVRSPELELGFASSTDGSNRSQPEIELPQSSPMDMGVRTKPGGIAAALTPPDEITVTKRVQAPSLTEKSTPFGRNLRPPAFVSLEPRDLAPEDLEPEPVDPMSIPPSPLLELQPSNHPMLDDPSARAHRLHSTRPSARQKVAELELPVPDLPPRTAPLAPQAATAGFEHFAPRQAMERDAGSRKTDERQPLPELDLQPAQSAASGAPVNRALGDPPRGASAFGATLPTAIRQPPGAGVAALASVSLTGPGGVGEMIPPLLPNLPKGTSLRPALLIDVTPLSLCVETVGGYVDVLVTRNTPVPCERTREFITAQDNQQTVIVRVAQGESRLFHENVLLGEVQLTGIPAQSRGQTRIAVTFGIDSDGILHVRALDVASGMSARADLRLSGAPTAPEIAHMTARQASKGLI